MTKKEAAIVTAYTGFVVGDFGETHKYIEQIMGRPVFTHEMASKSVAKQIKEAAREDFCLLEVLG